MIALMQEPAIAASLRASVAARVGIPDEAFSIAPTRRASWRRTQNPSIGLLDDECPITARQFIEAIAAEKLEIDTIPTIASEWLRIQQLRAEQRRAARPKWLAAVGLLDREGLSGSEIAVVLGRNHRWVREARKELTERLQGRAFRDYFDQLMRKNLKPGQSKEDAMKKIDAAEAKRVRKAERNLQLAKGK